MSLDKYISDLLYRYQCVTIPGFGAFLTEYKSAEIDAVKNIMLPPKKTVSFNRHLQNNDGLLANHVAIEENVSYADAVANIKQTVATWHHILDLDETLTLDLVGELSKNKEGNLEFVAFNTVNYNTDSFGLTNIVTPDVAREESESLNLAPVVASTPKITVSETKILPLAEPILAEVETPKTHQSLKTKKSASNYGSIAAVLAVLIGCGWGYKIYNDSLEEKVSLAVQKDVQDKVEKTIQEATFIMANPTETLLVKVDNSIKGNATDYSHLLYHVIAGSFKSEENALKKTQELQELGFTGASIIGKNPHNLYMVAYKSFADYSGAINALNTIQKNNNKEAWVYTKL
ncbi:SPOR domain-containing protein [Flavobacterium agricola]|uniref:SPOR domain-containing protein n=1 Tax=Flavobacterium agricola TaxID=2870839 RepID=A0ABY6LZU1_9FLAO|nr:SPOR domain-containing protein [Flavobacterium agricola]UYW01092.1 SPOR domain-containing protein [Flavobacterium agricola]